eukprot:gene7009-116_t
MALRTNATAGQCRGMTGIRSRPSIKPMAATRGRSKKTVELPAFPRGSHIVTRTIYEACSELAEFEVGLANLFCMHTSASLTINENASPGVPLDLADSLDRIVPEGRMYRHLDEGMDDMPAHVKSSLMGASLTVPVTGGRFAFGIWQGIYFIEHRSGEITLFEIRFW